jgi:hypothetical protein
MITRKMEGRTSGEPKLCSACYQLLLQAPLDQFPSQGVPQPYLHDDNICALREYLWTNGEKPSYLDESLRAIAMPDTTTLGEWNATDFPGVLLATADVVPRPTHSLQPCPPSSISVRSSNSARKVAFCEAGSMHSLVLCYGGQAIVLYLSNISLDIWTQSPAWNNTEPTSVQQLVPTISQWLRECYTYPEHSRCQKRPPKIKAQLPHRVIDVGPPDGSRPPRLLETHNSVGSYTVLSHCWGNHQPFVTNNETLKHNLESISLLELPKTFRDAVYITRGLGIRYLWIDSLCIIQGNAQDWQTESANMIGIFQNATLALAATAAVDSREGCCLVRRESSLEFKHKDTPKNLPSRSFAIPETRRILVRTVADQVTLRNSILEAPLNQRAWVLQELLLSSRVVHFAKDQMYWQCSSRLASEDGLLNERPLTEVLQAKPCDAGKGADLWLHSRIFGLVANLTSTIDWWDADIARDCWWTIVEEYSRRQLTRQSDKLPALAGLTEFFKIRTGDTPLAGLWKENILFGLLWHVCRPVTLSPVDAIPSWSWASVRGAVKRCPVYKTVLPSGEVFENKRYVGYRAKVSRCDLEWTGLPLVSPIIRGQIALKGRLKNIYLQNGTRYLGNYNNMKGAISSSKDNESFTSWYFSGIDSPCWVHLRPSADEDAQGSPAGIGNFDHEPPDINAPIACFEISFSSPFRDSSFGSFELENAFHEVLFLQLIGEGSVEYTRIGAGIIFANLDFFENARTHKILLN